MKYVLAQVYTNYIEAHLAMGMLESEQINCWLKDEHTVTIDPILTHAVGGIKLMVADAQLERAVELLSSSHKSFQGQYPCPKCGSRNIEYVSTPRKASNWLGTIINVVLSIGSPLPVDKVLHCFDCGCEFDI